MFIFVIAVLVTHTGCAIKPNPAKKPTQPYDVLKDHLVIVEDRVILKTKFKASPNIPYQIKLSTSSENRVCGENSVEGVTDNTGEIFVDLFAPLENCRNANLLISTGNFVAKKQVPAEKKKPALLKVELMPVFVNCVEDKCFSQVKTDIYLSGEKGQTFADQRLKIRYFDKQTGKLLHEKVLKKTIKLDNQGTCKLSDEQDLPVDVSVFDLEVEVELLEA